MKTYLSLRRDALTRRDLQYDGVGLLKGNHSGMKHHINHPEELKTTSRYVRDICDLFDPKPVWYRTNDASTSFINKLGGEQFEEANPHYGLRGIRRAIACPDTFRKEIEMLNAIRADHKNLNIVLSFVNDVAQYVKARDMAKGFGYTGRTGIMAELPSAVLTLDEFLDAGVDYVVFGMNDLSESTEGLSRKNKTTDLIFRDQTYKAVRKMLGTVNFGREAEFVLSGDIGAGVIQKFSEFPFDAVAIPYTILQKEKSGPMEECWARSFGV